MKKLTTQSERLYQASNAHASASKQDPKSESLDVHFVGYLVVGHLPSWMDNLLKRYINRQHLPQSAMRIRKKALRI